MKGNPEWKVKWKQKMQNKSIIFPIKSIAAGPLCVVGRKKPVIVDGCENIQGCHTLIFVQLLEHLPFSFMWCASGNRVCVWVCWACWAMAKKIVEKGTIHWVWLMFVIDIAVKWEVLKAICTGLRMLFFLSAHCTTCVCAREYVDSLWICVARYLCDTDSFAFICIHKRANIYIHNDNVWQRPYISPGTAEPAHCGFLHGKIVWLMSKFIQRNKPCVDYWFPDNDEDDDDFPISIGGFACKPDRHVAFVSVCGETKVSVAESCRPKPKQRAY